MDDKNLTPLKLFRYLMAQSNLEHRRRMLAHHNYKLDVFVLTNDDRRFLRSLRISPP